MDDFLRLLTPVLDRVLDGFERVVSADRLTGGASQETYRLLVEVEGEERKLALRRAAGGEFERSDESVPGLAGEARLMQVAASAGVPEPEVLYVLTSQDGLGAGFVMEWIDGETLGNRILSSPELDDVRPRLAYECGQILARIHAVDLMDTGLSDFLTVLPTAEFVKRMWERYEEFATPQPMIDFTARWLLDHLPPETEPRLVHNDFRNGNLMISPDGVVGVLDWETAHLGDPIRDLGWICTNSWRFGRRDLPVGGFGSLEDLLAGYAAESGIEVDLEHLRFWEVFGSFWWAIGCLNMAERWRNGPDRTVERPGIARRSSECQVDCVNLLIPGAVELVEPRPASSSVDMPSVDELLESVRDFLRTDLRQTIEGRDRFLALVASNSLDIVLREFNLGPAHREAEQHRLEALLDESADLDALRWRLTEALRSGAMELDRPGLADHLRTTVVNQLAIDQPRYSGFVAATS